MIRDHLLTGDVELWIVLGYVVAILIGARIVEAVARFHFARAMRFGTEGFEYVEAHDLYRCPQGEHLLLHKVEHDSRLAVYRARASACSRCPLKASCTPADEGRVVVRSMVAWIETDVGVFHRRVSALMIASAVAVCAAGLWRWAGRAGSIWLAIAFVAGSFLLIRELRTLAPAR